MEWFVGSLIMALAFLFLAALSELEIAYSSVRRSNVAKYEMERGRSTNASKTLQALLNKDRMIVVSLILLLIFIVTLVTPWILRGILPGNATLNNLVFGVYAVILFTLGELVFKNRGYRYSLKVALFTAPFFGWVLKVFFPLAWVLRLVYRLSGGEERIQMKEEDVVAAARVAQEDGTLNPAEALVIAKVLSVGNKIVGDLCIPLQKCVSLPLKFTLKQAREALNKAIAESQGFICIVDGKTIVGVMERRNLTSLVMEHIEKPEDPLDLSRWPGLVRPTFDLPYSKVISDILGLLQKNPCAVVNKEGEGTTGIITLEGVVNQILQP